MAYYSDPTFVEKLQTLRTPGQVSSGPFAATRAAVASRLADQATRNIHNTLNQQAADFAYNQAQFSNKQNWAKWGDTLSRAATDLAARQKINYDRQLRYAEEQAAKKRAKSGLLAGGLGALGTAAGAFLGGPAAPITGPLGGSIGSYVGGNI